MKSLKFTYSQYVGKQCSHQEYFEQFVNSNTINTVLNVIGTILAMPKFGIIGAAACTAVAFIVGNGILMNWYYWKVIKLDIIGFWKNIIRISIAPVIMVVVGTVALRVITVKKLWMVLILGVMYVVLFGIASWILEMNDYEKTLVTGMFHKIKR